MRDRVGRVRVGETAAVPRSVRAEARRTAVRRRAVGTRDRVIAHLALVAEIADRTGMASTRLAEAVGYPGSSVAFAQLLSGMERDGLISREVRGKRTYRIALSSPPATRISPSPVTEAAEVTVAFPGVPDYDELAALERLLVPGRSAAELDLLRPADVGPSVLGDEAPDELKVV